MATEQLPKTGEPSFLLGFGGLSTEAIKQASRGSYVCMVH